MKIFQKLFGADDSIETIIAEARKQIDANPTGHLPRPVRMELMRKIANPAIINKIYFECAKRVFPVWEAEFPGVTPVYEMLGKANDFLYRGQGEKTDFTTLADEYRNYIEGIDSDAGTAGLTALFLCYSIGNDAAAIFENQSKEDDNHFEWEDWTPDYFASMVISGGSPFLHDNSDAQKRKEFWLWFLDVSDTLSKSPDKPLSELKEIKGNIGEHKEHLSRTQTYKTKDIEAIIEDIIDRTIAILVRENADWDKCLLSSSSFHKGNRYECSVIKDGQKSEFSKRHYEIIQLFANIKSKMYEQNKLEGAWCYCCLTFDKNKNYDIEFNYDDKSKFLEEDLSPDDMKHEFEGYPRSKEFTPDWWQKILGKRAKYLN